MFNANTNRTVVVASGAGGIVEMNHGSGRMVIVERGERLQRILILTGQARASVNDEDQLTVGQ